MGTSTKSFTISSTVNYVFHHHSCQHLQQVQGGLHLVRQESSPRQEKLLSRRDVSFPLEAVCLCRHQQRWTRQQGLILQADRCCGNFAKGLRIRSCRLGAVQNRSWEGCSKAKDV